LSDKDLYPQAAGAGRSDRAAAAVALELALKQTRGVKDKVELCAQRIHSRNLTATQKIARGLRPMSAKQALADGEEMERQAEKCAADLGEATETLAAGIVIMHRQTEHALLESQSALRQVEVALASAEEGEKKAQLRALHDSTTKLPNRELFEDRLLHAIAVAKRHEWTVAVMFLDLDHFKYINDRHGHAAGDRVLKEVAIRLLRHCRAEDTLCRNGGDEFLYSLVDPQGNENIERIAVALLNTIASPIDLGAEQVLVRTSIGIAVFPKDGAVPEQLIINSDTAMYCAKKTRQGYAFFGA
jgi:diguanylate cyclase